MFDVLLSLLLLLAAVGASFGQPVITNQPQTQAVAPGATATFTIGASGAEPLAYQWQRNPGTGFSDLADRTNAVLVLTNAQPWDASDYRVFVTNLSGSRTSAVAHLYVMSPALLTNRVVIDNFDDNRLTGWTLRKGTTLTETNQQLTLGGYWPGVITYDPPDTIAVAQLSRNWSVLNGQTLEWRVDLVGMNQGATAATIELVNSAGDGTYIVLRGRDFIRVAKYMFSSGAAYFLHERALTQNTNVVLALGLTRVSPNLILTARILDKANHDAVLYERSVVDTPSVDRTLTAAELEAASGMRLKAASDIQAAPWISGGLVLLDVWQYNYDGRQPAALATFDNFELWTYRVPITRYVDASSANPAPPYTNWVTAARVIQDAVDAAVAGDEIVVTNGTYATSGRAAGTNLLINRVAVDKPLALRSVNGPEVTIIQGHQVPGTTNGDGAIRCVYLADGASLSGFTLTNGATRKWTLIDDLREIHGGGVWCESDSAVVSNCVLAGNSAASSGGGARGGTLNNCTLTANSAEEGGGASESTLNTCTLTGNSAQDGGGAVWGTLNNCTLIGNAALSAGGGAYYGTLNDCRLAANSARIGGGASGGLVIEVTLNNCLLTGNSANRGGGAASATLNNCTLTGNSALNEGGGAYGSEILGLLTPSILNNCVVYFNTAPDGANHSVYCTLNYCCTTPMPTNGAGNITNEPAFVDAAAGNYRLRPGSPCIDAGTNLSAILTNDLDGRPRPVDGNGDGLAAFDIGAYEYGALYVWQGSPSPTPPYGTWATAATNIQDAVDAALAGDEIVVTNGLYATGGRAVGTNLLVNRVAVDKPIALRSVNGPQFTIIQGAKAPGGGNGDGAIRCVHLSDGATLSGLTLTNGATRGSWDDYHREDGGGGVWCESTNSVVSNCVLVGNSAADYGGGAYGGRLNNCTLTGNSTYSGGGACSATLSNCTLTGNTARGDGGGASACTLSDCVLKDNTTEWGGGAFRCTLYRCTLTGNSACGGGDWGLYGGGAFQSTLYNCTLTANSAGVGGGAWDCTLNNCTLAGNAAGGGGGASGGTLYNCTLVGNSATHVGGGISGGTNHNCIVYFNTSTNGANYYDQFGGVFDSCCTTPRPPNGVGNITNAPLFVDYAGGNLRLQSNSPCINAGLNTYAPGSTDLDGLPRIVSGTVDIGAYEFQGPGSVISYAWLQHFGLPTDGSADATDADADGHTTWQEWRCQTDPTNALSALRLLSASPAGNNVTVSWQSVEGVSYFLERSTNLWATPPFTLLAPDLPGQLGVTSFTDTNTAGQTPLLYRVGVQ